MNRTAPTSLRALVCLGLGGIALLPLAGQALAAPAGVSPPTAPGSVSTTTKGTTATVKWQAPTSTGGAPITGYALSCTSADGGTARTATAAAKAKSATVPGLSADRTYRCSVSARNSAGSSAAGLSSDYVEHASSTGPAAATMHLPISAGQRATLQASGLSSTSTACTAMAIRDATGKQLTTGCLYAGETDFVDSPSAASAGGTWTATLTPPRGASASAELAGYTYADLHGTLTLSGAAVAVKITAPGQVAILSFPGKAGQHVELDSSAATMTGVLSVRNPAGQEIGFGRYYTASTSTVGPVTLPSAGSYSVQVIPDSYERGNVSIRLRPAS